MFDDDLLTSTQNALRDELLQTITTYIFTVVGCGGVGAYFAEMLVRTGARKITLVDGDKIETKNLNRTPFTLGQVDKYKVDALKDRLLSINKDLQLTSFNQHFGPRGDSIKNKIRDSVFDSDFVLIAIDNNKDRIECENMLSDNLSKAKYMSIGLLVDKNQRHAEYECVWIPKTPPNTIEAEGYGENNGSYMSIVMEAVSVGFNMMLYHLENPSSKKFRYIHRQYRKYMPINS